MSNRHHPIWTRDFILVCLANFSVFSGFYILLPILPEYVKNLGYPEGWVGLVAGAFTVSAVVARPWVGQTLESRGRRLVFVAGLAVFVVCALCYPLAQVLAPLLLLRVVHGIGWGASTTAASTIAADTAPATRRGEALGYFGMFANLAMVLGPALGVELRRTVGFRLSFWLAAILAFMAFAIGSAIRTRRPVTTPMAASSRGISGLLDKDVLVPSITIFFVSFTYGSVTTFVVLYAGSVLQVPNPGIYFSVYAAFLLLSRPTCGIISDRKGRRAVVIPGAIAVSLALFLLGTARGLPQLLLAAALNGAGFGAVHPSLMADTVERARHGQGPAMATFSLFFDLGIGLGAMLLGLVSQLAGYRAMYLAAALLPPLGLAAYLASPPAATPAITSPVAPDPPALRRESDGCSK